MVRTIEGMQAELILQADVIDELLELVFILQARVSAISEILIKDDITDVEELKALEMDNLNIIQYNIVRD